MTTIEEKKAMKPLNYYNEHINDNPLLRFKLESGKHFRRQLNDNTSHYEHIPRENDNKITNEEISNIKFDKIVDSGEKTC